MRSVRFCRRIFCFFKKIKGGERYQTPIFKPAASPLSEKQGKIEIHSHVGGEHQDQDLPGEIQRKDLGLN